MPEGINKDEGGFEKFNNLTPKVIENMSQLTLAIRDASVQFTQIKNILIGFKKENNREMNRQEFIEANKEAEYVNLQTYLGELLPSDTSSIKGAKFLINAYNDLIEKIKTCQTVEEYYAIIEEANDNFNNN